MSEDLEQELRGALQAEDPPEDIADAVAARLRTKRLGAAKRGRLWAWPASLAASALLVAGVQYQRHRMEVAAGLEARRQLLQALHVTNQKLDLALRAVQHQSQQQPDDAPGI